MKVLDKMMEILNEIRENVRKGEVYGLAQSGDGAENRFP